MAALVVHLSPFVAPSWLWLLCVLGLLTVPVAEWLRRDPQRVRFTVAFCVAVMLGSAVAFAAFPPDGVWDNCCDWLIPYGICWPIGWPPC